MAAITSTAEAEAALKKADDMFGDVAGGRYGFAREQKVAAEASYTVTTVLAYYEGTGNTYGVARVMDTLGFKARHVDDNLPEAKRYYQKAGNMFASLGREEDRLAALIELGEMEPTNAEAQTAAYDAITRGLPEPLDDRIDPRRLAAAIADAGDHQTGLDLYQTMIDDAFAKDRKARAAILLRDVARIHENGLKDKRKATEILEDCLAQAEAACDKGETGAALLRLMDIWNERGNRKKAREYFDRISAMRGLPSWQRKELSILKMVFG